MQVSAVKLWRDGDETVVEIEHNGKFFEVIRERGNTISHIVEERGLWKEFERFIEGYEAAERVIKAVEAQRLVPANVSK